jgi:polyhydroxyalkanoate synthase
VNDAPPPPEAGGFEAQLLAALGALLPPLPGAATAARALLQGYLGAVRTDPARLTALQAELLREQARLWSRAVATPAPADPADPWSAPFFALARDQHRALEAWTERLIALLDLPPGPRRAARFALRRWLEAAHPANRLATNPVALAAALGSGGASLARGLHNLRADLAEGRIAMSAPGAFEPGRDLAVTPGAVVHENPIAQLIRYAPLTPKVGSRPLLVVPPFINKYYVLDLQPANSFVRFALQQGLQVFMVSWRNATPALAGATWEDYLRLGVLEALDVANSLCATQAANVLGYCVGGTLAACAAAVDAVANRRRWHSLTLLAALLDFEDPGEVAVYVDEDYVAGCERDAEDGCLVPGARLAAAFASLRARELVWHFVEHRYLLGETPRPFDLLHWNGDATNLPGRLYAWLLRACYLENRLRQPGRERLLGQPVDFGRIRLPAYVFGALDDHIVPWRSAYAGARLLGRPPRFVLGESGHVAGVINPPVPGRRGWWGDGGALPADPAAWRHAALHRGGSWWHDWAVWIAPLAGRRIPAPASPGSPAHPVIEPAPGRYVRESARAAAGADPPQPQE